MNVIQSDCATQVIVVAMAPGEMLLECIQDAVKEQDIRNGAVVSGIGTLKTCAMHCITHTGFPPKDKMYTLEKPLELLSVNGIIADYEPHLHIVVSCGENEVYAGHLEPNSEVCYLAEIAILKFNDLALKRHFDEQRGLNLLGPA